ncbi:MAG: NAD-binding protein [Candidatus Marsarchaeota archaeon]|nr:NAD-binding protein [Candidatus Marsarchaeota archaeon]
MVKVDLVSAQNTSIEMVLLFTLISVFIFLFSFHELISINHNAYASGYLVLTAMFDAVDTNISVINITNMLSFNFLVVFIVLVMDGITKVLLIGFVMASFIEVFTSIDIKAKLQVHDIKKLKNHVIICGYSMFGEQLTIELIQKKIKFVVIDRDPVKAEMLKDLKYLSLTGNFLSEEILADAGILNAKYIVFGVKSDYSNLLGVITAKKLNKNINIISRAVDNAAVRYLNDISPGKYFIPEYIAGNEIGFTLLELENINNINSNTAK